MKKIEVELTMGEAAFVCQVLMSVQMAMADPKFQLLQSSVVKLKSKLDTEGSEEPDKAPGDGAE